jgi:uncharacterized protein (TIGR02679 family)
MPADLVRLRATLGDPALARLVEALRRRIELGRPLTGSLTLPAASEAERRALDNLLGRPTTRGDSLRVDLDWLAETLSAAGICPSLRDAVDALVGPVRERRAEAAAEERAWLAVRERAVALLAEWPAMSPWTEELFASGLLKRLAPDPDEATTLLADIAALARVLPAGGELLAALAARIFGDAHAFDPGTPRATLAVRAAARLGGVTLVDDAEGRREAWAAVGVLCDELSTPALVLNLPAANDTPTARLLRAARAEAEPFHLTLRQLLLWPLSVDPALAGREVFVCENPTIVALAARRLGGRCAPLVCASGQFATPVKTLLRQLAAAGARLRYHGDFDVGGLAIARRVIGEHGATPWRLGASDYRAAPKGKPLASDPGATPWDPALEAAMRTERRAVHEEAVFDTLSADLTLPPP